MCFVLFFFFKQKTAYEMRISDWSSDVCSSDLTWLKKTEIPADKSNYGAFTKLADDAEQHLREIIEAANNKKDKKDGSDDQKVGDLYASFMDQKKADALGLKPIAPELAKIDEIGRAHV